MSMRDFAESKDVKFSTFCYWVRKKKRADEPARSFISLRAVDSSLKGSLEIVYPNGVRIITDFTDISYLHRLIKLY